MLFFAKPKFTVDWGAAVRSGEAAGEPVADAAGGPVADAAARRAGDASEQGASEPAGGASGTRTRAE